MIDVVTGSTGITHIVVDACEVGPDGEHLVYDCTQHIGVTRVPWSEYSDRLARRIVLPGHLGLQLRGCLSAQVGERYGLRRNCASIITGCLPDYDGPDTPTPSQLLAWMVSKF